MKSMSIRKAKDGCMCAAGIPANMAYYILNAYERAGYNAGYYGWNCDIYYISDYAGRLWCITTGYRNLQSKHFPYEELRAIEKQCSETDDMEKRRELFENFLFGFSSNEYHA